MYTEEPHSFETQSEDELNKQYEIDLDKRFKGYDEHQYAQNIYKSFIYLQNCKNWLIKHSQRFEMVYDGFILKFKDDEDYQRFKSKFKRSKLMQSLIPYPNLPFKLKKDNTLKLKMVKR